VHFIAAEALPRNGTGKIMRAEVERWVSARESAQSGGSASP
jgi:acyl-coenzyme A synthetase/AMP-(fatty) acid ligase